MDDSSDLKHVVHTESLGAARGRIDAMRRIDSSA
jgi:hypothetical protein